MAKEVGFKFKIEGVEKELKEIGLLEQSLAKLGKERSGLIKKVKTGNSLTIKESKALETVKLRIDGARGKMKALNKTVLDNNRALGSNATALNKTGKALKKNSGFVNGIRKGTTQAMVGIGAAVVVFQKLAQVIGESLKLYDKQIKAENSLKVALGQRSEALLEQASALQQKTLFGDEEIIQGQAFLAQMNLTEEQILKVTPAILDMAQAQGMNLEDAFKLTSKTVGSSTNAMSRYGVEVEGAVGSNERLQSAIDNMNDKFEGQAESASRVGTGALTQLGNTWGDLKEKIGEFINEGVQGFIYAIDGAKVIWLDWKRFLNEKTGTEFDVSGIEKYSDAILYADSRFKGFTQSIQKFGIKSKEGVNSAKALLIALNKQYGDEGVAIFRKFYKEQLKFEKQTTAIAVQKEEQAKKTIKDVKKVSNAEDKALKKSQDDFFKKLLAFESFEDKQYRSKLNKLEQEEHDINTHYNALIEELREFKESEIITEAEYDNLINENEAQREQAHADRISAIDDVATAKALENEQLKADAESKRINDFEVGYSAVTSAVGAIIDASLSEQLAMYEGNQAKQDEIRKKHFERRKALQMAEVFMEGILEVARINSNPAVNADLTQTLRAILTASAIIRTGANLVTIANKKMAKGGVLKGATHEEGGIGIRAGGVDYEAENNEIVLTSGVYNNPVLRNQASRLNVLAGGNPLMGATHMASGGVIGRPIPSTQNQQAQLQIQATQQIYENVAEMINQQKTIVVEKEIRGALNDNYNNSTLTEW